MKKPAPDHYWNHRVMTTLVKWKEMYSDMNETNPYKNRKDERIFWVTEVHYENGVPTSYGDKMDLLGGHTSVKDINWTVNKIKLALKKPVLDKDLWPNEWHEPLTKKDVINQTLKNVKNFGK